METFTELINGSTPVVVDFFAVWCEPCKAVGPILKQVKSALGEKAKIIKIDVDKAPALAQQYNISSIPTLIIFKDGKVAWRQSGVVPPEVLKKTIFSFV